MDISYISDNDYEHKFIGYEVMQTVLRVPVIVTDNMTIYYLRNYYHNLYVKLIGFVETNEKNASKVNQIIQSNTYRF